MAQREYDEDDVRVRPGRSSRPRTRLRPSHGDAVSGFVTAVHRGRYECQVDGHPVPAMRARELGRKSVVVGDRVDLVGDVSGRDGSLARIVRIGERHGVLRRTADDVDPAERVVVANVDQLVIVTAVADPLPRTGFIDRCLVAAYDAGISPLLCITKIDLPASPEPLLAYYAALELAHVTCRFDAPPDAVVAALDGRVSALVGQSGVGKSTLVNRLLPGVDRAVGDVSAIGKGRHTSSSVVALPVPGGGWLVDTPGIRSFGLAHVSAQTLLNGFSDLAEGAEECPSGCDHSTTSVDCGLDAWVGSGHGSVARLESFRRLLASKSGTE